MNDPPNFGEESRLYRLLYRGSLSLPDSDLVLDGVTFIAKILPSSPSRLLECPVALALESMRGRPSLRFISIVKTQDLNYECKDVYMYIHPRSFIARRFFENILCADEVNDNDLTQRAIRLGFGDGHGADDSDILVFGRLSPFCSSLELVVGRIITPEKLSGRERKPRPDDPVPRDPLAFVLTKKPSLGRNRTSQPGNDGTQLGSKVGKARGKQKAAPDNELRHTSQFEKTESDKSRLKHKRFSGGVHTSGKDPCQDKGTTVDTAETAEVEITNKAIVKKLTVEKLLQYKITKDHPEFRDLFNHTIHSIGFALRQNFKAMPINLEDVARLVDLHVKMYLDG